MRRFFLKIFPYLHVSKILKIEFLKINFLKRADHYIFFCKKRRKIGPFWAIIGPFQLCSVCRPERSDLERAVNFLGNYRYFFLAYFWTCAFLKIKSSNFNDDGVLEIK